MTEAEKRYGEKKRAARHQRALELGLNPKTGKPYAQDKMQWQREYRAKKRGETTPLKHKGFTVHQPPSEEPTAEEIIADKIKTYDRKKENYEAKRLIQIDIDSDKPVGIVIMGDPHLDDPGCAIKELMEHMRLVNETPGMYCACVGDMANHWVGRLQRLWAKQNTTAKEAWILIKWFFDELQDRLLFVIGGNHDAFAAQDGDLLEWIAGSTETMYSMHFCRVQLNFPNGKNVVVNSRHDFPGHSQWNANHGPMKAAQLGGFVDDVYVAGHQHTSAYSFVKSPVGKLMHCIRVASYKEIDEFPIERGFRDQRVGGACCIVIDPNAEDPAELITVWCSPRKAAEHLTFIRSRVTK